MIDNTNQHTILVSGATGRQGGAVARHLLSKGFHVRALTRNPDQDEARVLAEAGAEIFKGSFGDRESLDRALKGAYGAYSVQPFTEGVKAEITWGKTFAAAAKAAGVRHFVYSAVAGADQQSGVPYFESKWKIEQYIRKIDLPYSIFRPTFFMDNWTTGFRSAIDLEEGTLSRPLSPSTLLQQIAVDDIGTFVTLAFTNPDQWKGQTVEIAGDQLTMTAIADIISRVTNRGIRYKQVPWEVFEERSGKTAANMYRFFDEGYGNADIDTLREQYPELSSFDSFLKKEWT